MARLSSFMSVSVDGCYADRNGDMSWAHRDDPEMRAFTAENAKGGGMLVFGRVTYQMMEAYWPSPHAAKNEPAVAEGINKLPKVVFSKTLERADWNNTTLARGDLGREVAKLKKGSLDLTILGSGTLVSSLAEAKLVDEYQLMIVPIILGDGKRLFDGVKKAPRLALESTRRFANGNVFVCYRSV
jgi:dihydrofolate reductase